jgi:hypothetical protein
MLMKTSPALSDSDVRPAGGRLRVAPVLWFVIGALLWVLFAATTIKYGVVLPEVMN